MCACGKLWLTMPQAAEHLSMCMRWVKTEVSAGRLPSKKIGRSRRILHADLEAFAAGRDDAGVIRLPRRRQRTAGRTEVRLPLAEYGR